MLLVGAVFRDEPGAVMRVRKYVWDGGSAVFARDRVLGSRDFLWEWITYGEGYG